MKNDQPNKDNTMTMFVVQYHEAYVGFHIDEDSRVFSTRELAEAYIAMLDDADGYDEYVITEVQFGG